MTSGALVTASQPTALDTIQRLDPIYVDVTQSSAEVVALRQRMARGGLDLGAAMGAEVRLRLEDGSDYPPAGRMQFTDITVDQTTGAVTLRAVFPNPAGLLLPGMYVRAKVVEGVDPAGVLVPEQGVSHDQRGNPTAMVVNRAGRVELRQLQTGQTVGAKWLVTSGLNAGDRVIVEGLLKVQPGAPARAVAASGVQ